MIQFNPPEHVRRRPAVQMTPVFGILIVSFLVFMALCVFSAAPAPPPGKIVINVAKNGMVVVNRKKIPPERLDALLQEISKSRPGQAVVVRADPNTYHKNVARVLDACARAKISNISFLD